MLLGASFDLLFWFLRSLWHVLCDPLLTFYSCFSEPCAVAIRADRNAVHCCCHNACDSFLFRSISVPLDSVRTKLFDHGENLRFSTFHGSCSSGRWLHKVGIFILLQNIQSDPDHPAAMFVSETVNLIEMRLKIRWHIGVKLLLKNMVNLFSGPELGFIL